MTGLPTTWPRQSPALLAGMNQLRRKLIWQQIEKNS
jgi:hypothetical protein